jgi:sirohydrochlorin ferrochelatase
MVLPDYQSFAEYAKQARRETLEELSKADIGRVKRVFVYPFGVTEGLLLDRLNPGWKSEYFKHPLSTDALFE